jgi:hypothetical protein
MKSIPPPPEDHQAPADVGLGSNVFALVDANHPDREILEAANDEARSRGGGGAKRTCVEERVEPFVTNQPIFYPVHVWTFSVIAVLWGVNAVKPTRVITRSSLHLVVCGLRPMVYTYAGTA